MATEFLKLYQREIRDDYGDTVHWIVEYRGQVYGVTTDIKMAKKIYERLNKLEE
jgi:hypothetical protein